MGPEDQDYLLRFPRGSNPPVPAAGRQSEDVAHFPGRWPMTGYVASRTTVRTSSTSDRRKLWRWIRDRLHQHV